jgi:hypothetical protein
MDRCKGFGMDGYKGKCTYDKDYTKENRSSCSIDLTSYCKGHPQKTDERVKGLKALPKYVFALPSANGANGVLGEWVRKAGIAKHITWSCARLSFSILLQDKNVDDATVAYLMGHTTTKQVKGYLFGHPFLLRHLILMNVIKGVLL